MTSTGQLAGTAKDEATTVAGTAKGQAADVASHASQAAGDVTGTAKQEAGNVLGTAAEQAKDLTGQVRDQASQQVQAQSQKATEALRGISQQLSEGDTSGVVGTVLTEAGKRVQAFADHLEQVGPEGLLEQASTYARRNPGTFLLGMAAAGFVAGRLTKGLSGGGQQEQRALPAGSSAGTSGLGSGYTTGTGYATGTAYGAGAAAGTGYATGAGYATGTDAYGSGGPDLAGSPYPDDVASDVRPDGTTTRGAL